MPFRLKYTAHSGRIEKKRRMPKKKVIKSEVVRGWERNNFKVRLACSLLVPLIVWSPPLLSVRDWREKDSSCILLTWMVTMVIASDNHQRGSEKRSSTGGHYQLTLFCSSREWMHTGLLSFGCQYFLSDTFIFFRLLLSFTLI